REVAQVGAALGREFSYELLRAVARRSPDELQAALQQLVNAELLFCRGAPPAARYAFKHALLRDATYATLLRSRRLPLHARIVEVVEAQFSDIAATQPELVAHHCAEAGLTEKSIDYYRKAAERAMRASANIEAATHLKRGLELLERLPPSPERAARELALQVALGVPLTATKGWAAPEVEAAYARARELCQGIGKTAELFHSVIGLFVVYLVRAQLDIAEQLTKQSFELAAHLGNEDGV